MVFNSAVFIYFFIIVLCLYWALGYLPRGALRAQNTLLLLAGYFFYGWWDWLYLGLILYSTVLDYWIGRAIDSTELPSRRKVLIFLSVASNLTVLGIFKYYDFFVHSFVDSVRAFNPEAFPDKGASLLLNAILPVGISFYTFQSMAYTVDVFRRVVRAERNFLDFASFVCFFPQLVAGPIERAQDLLVQFKANRVLTWDKVQNGAWLLLLGFYMKVYVADNLAPLVNQVYAPRIPGMPYAEHGGFQTLFASIGFVFQIYADFWGYSAIAMGAATFLGFRLTQNFNNPVMAQNPADLWRRWHISLNRWVTDYIYIPLGGSRLGEARKYINLLAAMTLMGLWHGASSTFLVWGMLMGLWLVAHQIVKDRLPRTPESWPSVAKKTVTILKMTGTWTLFALSATFFRARDMDQAVSLWKSLLNPASYTFDSVSGLPSMDVYFVSIVQKAALLLFIDTMAYRTGSLYWIFDQPAWKRAALYSIMLFCVIILGEFGKDVIYFAF
jgi:alginate O-acetyltransferase complex protein AlgI